MKIWINFLVLVLFYPVLFIANYKYYFLGPYLPLILVAWLIFLMRPGHKGDKRGWSLRLTGRLNYCVTDPIFWSGLLFVGYLWVQWWNSGGIRFQDPAGEIQMARTGVSWLPFSVDKQSAWIAFVRTFAAFSLVIFVRHSLKEPIDRRRFFKRILVASACLGAFGVIQFLTAQGKLLWQESIGVHFFALFGYENHGGAYFVLLFAVGCGLLVSAIQFYRGPKLLLQAMGYTVLMGVCVVMTYSRSCYLFLGGIAAVAVFYLFVVMMLRLKGAMRWISVTLLVAVVAGVMGIGAQLVNERMSREVMSMTKDWDSFVNREMSIRTWQWETALNIWQDYPWMGVGYNSHKFLQNSRLENHYKNWAKAAGKANVHQDYFQYLQELGILGALPALFFIFALAVPLFTRKFWLDHWLFFPLLGIAANLVHATFDLPYRNSGVFSLTAVLLVLMNAKVMDQYKESIKPRPKRFHHGARRLAVAVWTILLIATIWQVGLGIRQGIARSFVEPALISTVSDSRLKTAIWLDLHCWPAYTELGQRLVTQAQAPERTVKEKSALMAQALKYLAVSYRFCEDDPETVLSLARAGKALGYEWEVKNALILSAKKYRDHPGLRQLLTEYYLKPQRP